MTPAVTTVKELDALPVGTMIRDQLGDLHVSYRAYGGDFRWQEVGFDEWRLSKEMVREVGGTFTVLYQPDERTPNSQRPSTDALLGALPPETEPPDDVALAKTEAERLMYENAANSNDGEFYKDGFLDGWASAKGGAAAEIKNLRAERREIAAEAWQQGYDAALADELRDVTTESLTENPYLSGGSHE